MPRYRADDPFAGRRVKAPGRAPQPPVNDPPPEAPLEGEALVDALRAAHEARQAGAPDLELEARHAFVGVRTEDGTDLADIPLATVGELVDRIEAVAGGARELHLDTDPDTEADRLTVAADLLPAAAVGENVVVMGPDHGQGNIAATMAHVSALSIDPPLVELSWGPAAGHEPETDPQSDTSVDTTGWVSSTEAAALLGVDPAEVRRRARAGELIGVKTGEDDDAPWLIQPASISAQVDFS